MKRSNLTDKQIAVALRQAKEGVTARNICRKFGIWNRRIVRQLLLSTTSKNGNVSGHQ